MAFALMLFSFLLVPWYLYCTAWIGGELFALSGLVCWCGISQVTSNSISASFENAFHIPPLYSTLALVLVAAVIVLRKNATVRVLDIMVPVMAACYFCITLFIIVKNAPLLPGVFGRIFAEAFGLRQVVGGGIGAVIMNGTKRGLFSNEAGVGSAPNAAASASVSHPVKQGLVQMLSVFIDTIVICSATSFLLLCSGIAPSDELKGMPWVQAAAEASLGGIGITFITIALFLFAFTTLIGNFFYAEMGLGYLCDKKPNKWMLIGLRAIATVVVFGGSLMEFSVAWSTADVIMGFLALINLPVIIILGGPAIRCMKDYMRQKREGKNPVFRAKDIGLGTKTDFWN